MSGNLHLHLLFVKSRLYQSDYLSHVEMIYFHTVWFKIQDINRYKTSCKSSLTSNRCWRYNATKHKLKIRQYHINTHNMSTYNFKQWITPALNVFDLLEVYKYKFIKRCVQTIS